MKITLISLLMMFGVICGNIFLYTQNEDGVRSYCPSTVGDSIKAILTYHLNTHPYSHYFDVYKSFMQDYFGPGHILIDPVKSKAYLRRELDETSVFRGPIYEPTGYEGNFVRVNLSLIKDGIISEDDFFDAFLESSKGNTPPSGEEWERKWKKIDSCIIVSNIHFSNEEKERENLKKKFLSKEYIVHHTEEFNDSSYYHYRIMSKDVFNRTIKPLISENNQ